LKIFPRSRFCSWATGPLPRSSMSAIRCLAFWWSEAISSSRFMTFGVRADRVLRLHDELVVVPQGGLNALDRRRSPSYPLSTFLTVPAVPVRVHPMAFESNRRRAAEPMRARALLILISLAVLTASTSAMAQVAGSTTIGVAVAEMKDITVGWSAKKQIMGKTVYNEKNERVGTIDDIIIAPDKAVSYAIVGAGGFVGVGRHDVAIPVNVRPAKRAKPAHWDEEV
jgi:hypothetical protein